MCPLPHTAHRRYDVTAATLTAKEAGILKSIRTIHRLPSQQAARPTPDLIPPRSWSRPQHIPPYRHPQLPSKCLSLIFSPSINLSNPVTLPKLQTHECSVIWGRTAPRLCCHLAENERPSKQIKVYKTSSRHALYYEYSYFRHLTHLTCSTTHSTATLEWG
jgi:hypothetical protein